MNFFQAILTDFLSIFFYKKSEHRIYMPRSATMSKTVTLDKNESFEELWPPEYYLEQDTRYAKTMIQAKAEMVEEEINAKLRLMEAAEKLAKQQFFAGKRMEAEKLRLDAEIAELKKRISDAERSTKSF